MAFLVMFAYPFYTNITVERYHVLYFVLYGSPDPTARNKEGLGGSALFAIEQRCPLSQGRKHKETIMENGQNKKLQGRREFFKEAAKKALPIIGAVALLSNPVIAKAVEKEKTGCQNDCTFSCSNSCLRTCSHTCEGGCGYNCEGTCWDKCTDKCTSCTGSCYYYCTADCESNCSGSCSSTCKYSCSWNSTQSN